MGCQRHERSTRPHSHANWHGRFHRRIFANLAPAGSIDLDTELRGLMNINFFGAMAVIRAASCSRTAVR
jgi:hypothetical protein